MLDPSDVRFWRRHVVAGVALSVVTCGFVLVYLLGTWDRPYRTELLAVIGAAVSGSVLLLVLPIDRVLRTRARHAFFLAWSAAVLGLVTLLVAIEGAQSMLLGLYFLPLVFATMSYPLGPMIVTGAMTVGAFVAVALADGRPLADVALFASALATAAWMCAWQSRLHGRQRTELARLSRADPLTGCLNRRGFQERLDAELGRATRAETPVGLVLIDLDDFKAVNDVHGHAAGDALLCWIVARVAEAIRPTDALGRLGGDEFAVLLPEADAAEAADVAIRIEAILAERIAASTGVATFPQDGIVGEELHAAADRRLYAAKRGPRPPRRSLDRSPR